MIKYQNGTKEVFDNIPTQVTPRPGDNSNELIEIARSFMNQQITTESNGACKLMEFNKQNGILQEFFGQKIYSLEYRLIIEAQKDFWKESADKYLNANWYWKNFKTFEKKGDIYAETFTNNYSQFKSGTSVEIFGKIDFEYTDNGWRIMGKSMFSPGYENTRSKVLLEAGKESPPKKTYDDTLTVAKTADTAAIKETYSEDLGKKDGFGKMKYENGNVYEGEWKDGKRHGKGEIILVNGGSYEGEWKDDKRNGQGKMLYKDGSSYEGEWKDDKLEGFGTVIWANGRKYVGNLINGQKHGKGTTYNEDGTIDYEGEYKNGKNDGYGISYVNTKELEIKYEGEWKSDEMHGQGIYSSKNKKDGSSKIFTGEFQNGEMFNGALTIFYLDGSKSIVEYKNGHRGKAKKVKD